MKLNFGKRLVLFIHWLMSLALCALVVALFIRGEYRDLLPRLIEGVDRLAFAIAALVVYLLFAAGAVAIICGRAKKGDDHGFIVVDSSENGRTRIAIGAVEQMIRQAVRGVPGIVEMRAGIVKGDDSISIDVDASILNGSHVPTVTNNIQRAIRSYIELNCGVSVRGVSVSVHSLANAEELNGKRGRKNKTKVGNAYENPTPVVNVPVTYPEAPAAEPAPMQAPVQPEPVPAFEEAPAVEAAPVVEAVEPEPEIPAEPEAAPVEVPVPAPEVAEAPAEPEAPAPKKKGLFGRIFGKRKSEPAPEAPVEEAATEEAPAEPAAEEEFVPVEEPAPAEESAPVEEEAASAEEPAQEAEMVFDELEEPAPADEEEHAL